MKVNLETIEHVANLARLNLTMDEKKKLTIEMEGIIAFVDKLNELDTKDIKPMEHVIPMKNILREDVMEASYDREKILMNAPSHNEGGFKVPRVIE